MTRHTDDSDAFALSVQRVLRSPLPADRRFTPLALRGKTHSLEVLAPAATSPLREADVWACVVAMLATIIGGGALSVPYAFKLCGLRGGLLLLALSALASDFALYALCSASRRTGTATLAELAKAAQGPYLENAVVVALFLLCGFVAIAYTRLLRDLLGLFLAPFFQKDAIIVDRALVLCATFVLFPLSLYRELYRLRYAAFISFGGALCVAALFTFRAWPTLTQLGDPTSLGDRARAKLRPTPDNSSSLLAVALVALPIMSMSFLCQFNVLSVHARLKKPTRERLKLLLHTVVAMAFLFYVVFGVAGMIVCADAPDDVAQDALSCLSYADKQQQSSGTKCSTDILLACAGGSFAVALLLNTPALVIPLRDSCLVLCSKAYYAASSTTKTQRRARRKQTTERTPLANIEEDGLPPQDDAKTTEEATAESGPSSSSSKQQQLSATFVHVTVTACIIVVVIIGAQRVPGVASVWAVAGSSVGLFVAYLLPCYLYLKVRGHKDDGPARIRKAFCAILFVSSLVLAVLCTYRNAKAILFGA